MSRLSEILGVKDEMLKRNMTAEHIVEYMKFEDECVEKGFTFKSLIEAREKQIPKKPIIKLGHAHCPKCMWDEINKTPYDISGECYCQSCGQALDLEDWSEKE